MVAGQGGVPATGATAAVLNVTATNTTARSYLTLYADGESEPLTSNLNWCAGETVANLVTVRLGPTGIVEVANASRVPT
jgi:serine protease